MCRPVPSNAIKKKILKYKTGNFFFVKQVSVVSTEQLLLCCAEMFRRQKALQRGFLYLGRAFCVLMELGQGQQSCPFLNPAFASVSVMMKILG